MSEVTFEEDVPTEVTHEAGPKIFIEEDVVTEITGGDEPDHQAMVWKGDNRHGGGIGEERIMELTGMSKEEIRGLIGKRVRVTLEGNAVTKYEVL